MLLLTYCVRVLSETIEARIFKPDMHVVNELMYNEIEKKNRLIAIFSPLSD